MLKKTISALLVISFLFVFACGNTMVLDVPAKTTTGYKTATIGTYGLINKDDDMNPNVKYRLIVGNFIWSIILAETIIAPIYFIGFSIYEPVGVKTGNEVKGEKG
uniref:Lipoprotein n=1 Tax=viral metagenome TaxID=1070528 RepID=A0A6M3LMX0_9ZZZZ